MERFVTVAATSNGSLSQRPIFKSNESSRLNNTYTSFPPKPPPPLGDASFSSYLPPQEPKSNRISNRGGIDDSDIGIFEAERYFNEIQDQKENKKVSSLSLNLDRIVDRCDIPTIAPRLSSVSSVDGYGRNYRTGSFNATPTASSEASWNSQSGLLSHPPGSISVSMRNLRVDNEKKKGSGSGSGSSSSSNNWFFNRKCPCSGKKSVQIEEKFSETKTPNVHQNNSVSNISSFNPTKQSSGEGEGIVVLDERPKLMKSVAAGNWVKEKEVVAVLDQGGLSPENGFPIEKSRRVIPSGRPFTDNGTAAFSFPILSHPPAATKMILHGGKPVLSQLEDPPRESLEVFRPTEESTVRKSTDLRRLSVSESDRRSFNFPASPKIRPTPIEDDVVSDASSDLFEIESFSTQSTMYPMYRRRDSLDEISSFEGRRYGGSGSGFPHFRRSLDETTAPSIAPTECYEPSEVSIDWSVTTAEGGSISNFSIAGASDYDESRFLNNQMNKVSANSVSGPGTISKRKGNGLLSCRCEKAVSVGPNPIVKSVSMEQRHHINGSELGRANLPQRHHINGAESGRPNPAMSRLSDLSSMHVGRASGKVSITRSLSARMSRQTLASR